MDVQYGAKLLHGHFSEAAFDVVTGVVDENVDTTIFIQCGLNNSLAASFVGDRIVIRYSLAARTVDRLPISGPVIFVLFGLALGPLGLGWFKDDVERTELRVLVDLTLALILFSDAANSNLSVLRRQWQLVVKLI